VQEDFSQTAQLMAMDASAETKICERCHAPLVCRSQDIQQCDCNKVYLTPETITVIRQQFGDCLCNQCLIELSEQAGKEKTTT